MSFPNAVSLVVFSLVLIPTEAVRPYRENATSNVNITFTLSSNVTGESMNQTVISQNANTTKDIKNHKNSNIETPTKPILDKKARPESYTKAYKNILQELQLERGMKMQDLNVLLQKLGMQDCSRRTNNRVKQYQIFLSCVRILFCM